MTATEVRVALRELGPAQREVLELSLRRRIPDDAIASVLGLSAQGFSARRAAAVDEFSRELGIHRGEELGQALRALTEDSIWDALEREPRRSSASTRPPATRSVLGARGVRALLIAAAALSLAGGVIAGAAAVDGDSSTSTAAAPARSETRLFVPQPGRPTPFPSEPVRRSSYEVVRVGASVVLRARPDGPRVARIGRRTEFGSPRVLGIVRRRGGWLGVFAPELRNGQVGWMRSQGARIDSVGYSLHVDRSQRRLVVRRGGVTVRRMTVTVGRRENPTPTGRFAVTDALRLTDRESPYGCCVLALSGHQTKLPADWSGGDRLAIHASRDAAQLLGSARSLGCLRAPPAAARWLIEVIPLGAPIFIRP